MAKRDLSFYKIALALTVGIIVGMLLIKPATAGGTCPCASELEGIEYAIRNHK